jgi:hypothetical protein
MKQRLGSFALLAALLAMASPHLDAQTTKGPAPVRDAVDKEGRFHLAALIATKALKGAAATFNVQDGDMRWSLGVRELRLHLPTGEDLTPADHFTLDGQPVQLPGDQAAALIRESIEHVSIPSPRLRARIYLGSKNVIDPQGLSALAELLFGIGQTRSTEGGRLIGDPEPQMMLMDKVDDFLRCMKGCVENGGSADACANACSRVVKN